MKVFSPGQLVRGGCLLAFGASFLNTGFLVSTGTSVSHLTGDIARIGSGLTSGLQSNSYHIISVTLATLGFVSGAVASGYVLHHPTLEIKLPYGRILSSFGIFLIAAHFTQPHLPLLAIAITSAVCGAQNAMASRYRGMVLRTTHLTGLFTDFGIYLGMKMKGHHVENWKLFVPVWLTFAFLAGAVTSSTLVFRGSTHWILLAGIAYLVGGLIWSIYKRTGNRKKLFPLYRPKKRPRRNGTL
ncbi:MAG: YoaK family protein [Verrucomicrobiales bacterium]|nr:YoaK family protein [Verrucomicrobiales bacterium]